MLLFPQPFHSVSFDVTVCFSCLPLGFHFSNEEPTALLQCEGGPCAVLAPVQAFIIKTLLEGDSTAEWRQVF